MVHGDNRDHEPDRAFLWTESGEWSRSGMLRAERLRAHAINTW